MKTPVGKECRFYYADFHRGRNRQECRLLLKAQPAQWRSTDCARCPVPDILWANASEYLELRAHLEPGFLGIGRKVRVTAYCTKHQIAVEDPYAGCDSCAAERPGLQGLIGLEDL